MIPIPPLKKPFLPQKHILAKCRIQGYTSYLQTENAVNLTQKQEWIIDRYLSSFDAELGDVSDVTRERAVARMRARIEKALHERHPAAGLHEEDLMAALRALGEPSEQAINSLASHGGAQGGGFALSTENRKWLGVCAGLADTLGVDATLVRAATLLLGVTGPLILVIYLALYFEAYFTSDAANLPRIDKVRVGKRVASAFFAAVGLDAGTRIAFRLIREGYEQFAKMGAFPGLGPWDWYRDDAAFVLFCTLSMSVPLAILSALPLPNEWGHTFKRITQAMLAVYALVLCLAMASFLAGIIVHVATGFSS